MKRQVGSSSENTSALLSLRPVIQMGRLHMQSRLINTILRSANSPQLDRQQSTEPFRRRIKYYLTCHYPLRTCTYQGEIKFRKFISCNGCRFSESGCFQRESSILKLYFEAKPLLLKLISQSLVQDILLDRDLVQSVIFKRIQHTRMIVCLFPYIKAYKS